MPIRAAFLEEGTIPAWAGEPSALQAAHVKVMKGRDFNASNNGILLRADIHALLDALLITFTQDGNKLEISHTLNDKTYSFLDGVSVRKTKGEHTLSPESIKSHRDLFNEEEEKRLKENEEKD